MNVMVKQKFESYPPRINKLLHQIRELILTVAEQEGITSIEETLKWGEPSYVSNIGSTIRVDWKENPPEQYGIYFNCKTTLVETFKEIYGDTFKYEGNRAIILRVEGILPIKELSHCISMSLRYKKIKHLALLGL
ncbi:DUF1801 domain-containing protein [Colwellia sp. 20A7]|uniref:DUF1801 domain-containing protein n=1 Tax=Colwellia sp. 20A7 TaxID=2689569 RepID=UPI00135A04AC|nr:DUF1801 domain-containing protein [Colwellia sp. 20A7]